MPSSALDGRQHLGLVGLAAAVDDDVLLEEGLLGQEAVEPGDVAADLADRYRQPPEVPGLVGHADPDAEGERGGGSVCHRRTTLPVGAPADRNRFATGCGGRRGSGALVVEAEVGGGDEGVEADALGLGHGPAGAAPVDDHQDHHRLGPELAHHAGRLERRGARG